MTFKVYVFIEAPTLAMSFELRLFSSSAASSLLSSPSLSVSQPNLRPNEYLRPQLALSVRG